MSWTFRLLLVLLSLSSCAQPITPMQQELSSKTPPMYEGRFTPIQAPVSLEYRPAVMTVTGQVGIHQNVRDKDEFFAAELVGRLRVSPAGDALSWEFKLENAAMGEEKISSGPSPLVEFRARRDKQGATQNAEIVPVGLKAGSAEERRLFDEIRALLRSQFMSLSAQLPVSPIQEGSLLMETDMTSTLHAYERLWGSPRCSPPKEKIGYVARGLGFFKGRKVIVAVMEEDFVCVARNERRYNFALHGYALLDTQTAQIVEHKIVTTVKSFYSFDSVELRTLQKMSGEIIE